MEESFGILMNPQINLEVVDARTLTEPTVRFFVEEEVAWKLAARRETTYTAYIKGLALRAKGQHIIRDLELVDEILETVYTLMKEEGKDMAALFMDRFHD